MYRSYSYNDMPEPITQKKSDTPKPVKPEVHPTKPEKRQDDLILMLVAALLLLNDCDDKPLLLALAYVFISDYM